MDQRITAAISSAVCAGLLGIAVVASESANAHERADPNIVVTLRGPGTPVEVDIPGVDTPGDCLETELFDTRTDRLIGTGIDCIDIAEAEGADFLVNRTTIFKFRRGILVANGPTTVVPIFGDSSPDFTHVVGDVDSTEQNIIFGTRRFAHATGSVRLSGIVNLSEFPATVGFNCIFVIDLD